MKENIYYGMRLGILGNMDGRDVSSNAESGEGNASYGGISVEIYDRKHGLRFCFIACNKNGTLDKPQKPS